MRQKIITNSFWSLLNQLMRVSSLALVTILLSRHFGPQRFGALAIGFSLVRIFAVIAVFGLDRIIVKHLIEHEDRGGAIVREAFWLKLVIGLVSYMAMLGLIFALPNRDSLVLAIAALAGGVLIFQASEAFDYAFQAQNRFRLSFFGRSIPVLLSTAVKTCAVILNAPLLVFAILETVEAAAIATALYLIYRRSHSKRTMSILPASVTWPRLLSEGLPLLLSALAIMVYMRSDIIMLGQMLGTGAAGIYAAASQISEACALLPVALLPALFPILVRWRSAGPDVFLQRFDRLFLGAVVAGLCFSLTLTVAAKPLMNLIFGPSYASAANILAVHGWTLVFIFLGVTQSGYDVSEGLTWFATLRTVLGALLNIALNLFLIPSFGAVGSAVATLIAQIFSAVLLNALHPRTRAILRLQLMSILLVPAVRALARGRQSSDNRAWLPA